MLLAVAECELAELNGAASERFAFGMATRACASLLEHHLSAGPQRA